MRELCGFSWTSTQVGPLSCDLHLGHRAKNHRASYVFNGSKVTVWVAEYQSKDQFVSTGSSDERPFVWL